MSSTSNKGQEWKSPVPLPQPLGIHQRLCVLFALFVGMLLFLAPAAGAATPTQLWQVPESGESGSAAGQLDHPKGIAADPDSGHVYIADRYNARVSEFDAWGEFV